jgi:hypothetical protein
MQEISRSYVGVRTHKSEWKETKMRIPSPTSLSSSERHNVISEDDEDNRESHGTREDPRHHYRSRNWLSRFWQITRTGRNADRRPPVGRCCFVLRGDPDQDLGRMVMVVRQTKCMVVVRWKDEHSGEPSVEKLKHPGSLVQLEDGLEVQQDAQGMLWIQREREE